MSENNVNSICFLSASEHFGKNGWMTFLVKRTLFLVLLLKLDFMQFYTHEIAEHYWSRTTKIFLVWKLSSLKSKSEVFLTYKNCVIKSGRTLFYTFFHFPEDVKYRSYKNKAGKKLEGNTSANILLYKVYVERA